MGDQPDVRGRRFVREGFPLGKEGDAVDCGADHLMAETQVCEHPLGGFVAAGDDDPRPGAQRGQRRGPDERREGERRRRTVESREAGARRGLPQGGHERNHPFI
jgi:hypothetical protein